MEDNPALDKEINDERDISINVEKSKEFLEDFNKFIRKYTKKDILTDKDIKDSFRSKIQKPVEEIVRTIPKELKAKIKDVNWAELRRFRNFIVHKYDDVEWDTMWDTALEKMKEIEKACKRVEEVLKEK
jgi:uncharacterized protein with HEPN domain